MAVGHAENHEEDVGAGDAKQEDDAVPKAPVWGESERGQDQPHHDLQLGE